jgi:uncharacterized protein involved in exopolysaccharide biosynthesis
VKDHKDKVAELQALIDTVPDVEAELARLNRDYNVINEQYQAMVRSRETQDLSEKASNADEVAFRVIDPPAAGVKPVSPNRPMLLAVFFIMGLGVGGVACWLLAQLKPVFTSIETLRNVCGLPVLGAVSEAPSPQQRARRRVALAAFAAAMGCFVVLAAAAVLLEFAGRGVRSLLGLA